MYQWLKARQNVKSQAKSLYHQAVTTSRTPEFYNDFGVPDTFDGRFEMLCIHVTLTMRHLDNDKTEQALFDVMFRDMDRSLREAGVGDLGVPKHMKRMMKAFKGRYFYYGQALDDNDKEELKLVLRRNAYGTLDDVNAKKLDALAEYMMGADKADNLQELKYAS